MTSTLDNLFDFVQGRMYKKKYNTILPEMTIAIKIVDVHAHVMAKLSRMRFISLLQKIPAIVGSLTFKGLNFRGFLENCISNQLLA